jgi:hypothetical protein
MVSFACSSMLISILYYNHKLDISFTKCNSIAIYYELIMENVWNLWKQVMILCSIIYYFFISIFVQYESLLGLISIFVVMSYLIKSCMCLQHCLFIGHSVKLYSFSLKSSVQFLSFLDRTTTYSSLISSRMVYLLSKISFWHTNQSLTLFETHYYK